MFIVIVVNSNTETPAWQSKFSNCAIPKPLIAFLLNNFDVADHSMISEWAGQPDYA